MKYEAIEAKCKYYEACGGCQLQHMKNVDQNKLKTGRTKELLGEFGEVADILAMNDPYNYRNKIHRSFKYNRKKQLISGMYSQGSHDLIDIDACIIEDPIAGKIALAIERIMKKYKMEPYDEDRGTGFLRHILVRTAYNTGEVMLVLVTSSSIFPGKKNFVKLLTKEFKEIKTIVLNINDKKTSMILGEREEVIYGPGFIVDNLLGLSFRISPKSFYQINPIQTEVLYSKTLELLELDKNDILLDAYCGIGTIGLIASKKVKKVIGVEINKKAVEDSKKNMIYNKVDNAEFYCQDASDFMVNFKGQIDVLVMDPPRSGADEVFLESLVKLGPEKIGYISCNIESQRRDLQYLTEHGYKVTRLQPVDMFPQTNHIENIAILRKNI